MTDREYIIEALGVDKYYGIFQALDEVTLKVPAGAFVALVGPSGCGKTSLLKILAGFEGLTNGSLRMDQQSMVGVPPQLRPARMVFQRLALFPHRTVRENIGFPLKVTGAARSEIDARVREMMAMMHLNDAYLQRYPNQLSGGEQQRVALARAIVSKPDVLLLDEPLSALDAKLKKSLQAELKHLHREIGTTFVHVTHDLEEAMVLADMICVMRGGRVVQVGPPADIYYRPRDSFVANFIGDTNLIPVELAEASEGTRTVRSPLFGEIALPPKTSADVSGREGVLMVRPELVEIAPPEAPLDTPLGVKARVSERFIKGGTIQYRLIPEVEVDYGLVAEIQGTETPPADVGDRVQLGWRPEAAHLMGA